MTPVAEKDDTTKIVDNGKEMTLDEYQEKVFKTLTNRGVASIMPEALLGFQVGNHVDFSTYTELELTHPKEHDPKGRNYYDLEQADPHFLEIFEGIENSGEIEDPIIVYPHETSEGEKFLVITDGATRASIIGYLKGKNPDVFKRIPIQKSKAKTLDEARAEMVKRNLEGRYRMLTGYETMQSIGRFAKWGWTNEEILERLSRPKTWMPQLVSLRKCSENLIPEAAELYRDGKIKTSAAVAISKEPAERQEATVKEIKEKIQSGKKVTGEGIKGKQVKEGTRKINPISRVENFLEKVMPQIEDSLKSHKKFSACQEDYDKLTDALTYFADTLHKNLDKNEEE